MSARYDYKTLILSFFLIFFVTTLLETKFDFVGLTFLAIIIQALINISSCGSKSVSLFLVFNLFNLIFFGIVPWLHYSEGKLLWRSFAPDHAYYFLANFIIISSSEIFSLAYRGRLFKHDGIASQNYPNVVPKKIIRPNFLAVIILSFGCAATVYQLCDQSFLRVLFKVAIEGEVDASVSAAEPVKQLIEIVARLIPVFCFYIIFHKKKNWFLSLCLFGLMVFCVFPAGVSRFMVACVYLPVFIFFLSFLRRGRGFTILMVFSIIFLFPFLEQFRDFQLSRGVIFSVPKSFFYEAHFDAYENFISVVIEGLVTNGNQLLGAILFFIPRSIWFEKPVGSGYFLAEKSNYAFSNISMPYIGEGFINFGFVGVYLFIFFLGVLSARIDNRFDLTIRFVYLDFIYAYFLSAFFFMLRGDLMSSLAYAAGAASAAIIVNFIGGRND